MFLLDCTCINCTTIEDRSFDFVENVLPLRIEVVICCFFSYIENVLPGPAEPGLHLVLPGRGLHHLLRSVLDHVHHILHWSVSTADYVVSEISEYMSTESRQRS